MKRYFFRKLRADESGNFGVLTVILVPIVLLLCGIALNLVNAMNAKNQLQAASDAAALAVSAAYNTGTTTQQALDRIAAQFLNANVRSSGVDPQSITLKVSISGGSQKQARVDVHGKLDTFLPAVLGQAKMDISAKTVTSLGSKAHYQIAFLVDVSGSMAIGATDDDIMKLKGIKEINCEFACHDPGNAFANDKAAIAKAAGIKLKFDYVQSALGIFVDKLKLVETVNPAAIMSVYLHWEPTSKRYCQ